MGRLRVVGAALVLGLGVIAAVILVPTGPRPVTYEVVRGDTLFVIAQGHGVTVDDLRGWNGLEGDLIEVGQVLTIYPGDVKDPLPGRRARRTAPARTVRAPTDAPERGHAPLVMPAAAACLEGPQVGAGSEPTMAASVGLSREAIVAAMDGFLHHTTRCVHDGVPEGTLHLELTVACSGRVARVDVVDDPGWDPQVVACVVDVLGYVPFPAHALPDGDFFGYPLAFTR